MPPAKEIIELVWWQQSFEEAGSPVRFNVRHVSPFGDKGSFDSKGNDMVVSEADLIAAAATAGITLDGPSAMADAIIAHVAETHWVNPSDAKIEKAKPAPPVQP